MTKYRPTPVQKNSLLRVCEESFKHIITEWDREQDLISFFNTHPSNYEQLVEIALTDKHPEAWHATWVLDPITIKNDERITRYIERILDCLPNRRDGHQRQWLRVLERIELNDEQEGRLFDICLSIWEKIGKIPSVRGFAFSIMVKIVKKYPDLLSEIEFISQDHYLETLSPGIKRSIVRTIKELLI